MNASVDRKIKAIIVDDERLAIRGIELLLKDYPAIETVGSTCCIEGAVHLIQTQSPDLIFLDIQLQGETGFDLFEQTAVAAKIVFITAFDAYAVRAFEINALDYLLKPVSRERFGIAMERIFTSRNPDCDCSGQLQYNDVVALNTGNRMRFVKLHQILYILAEGDYSRVCINGSDDELVLKPMKAWEAMLPGEQFARVHRSTIINMECVHKIERTTSNRYLAYLSDNPTPLPMSQRYSARLRKKISSKVKKIGALR